MTVLRDCESVGTAEPVKPTIRVVQDRMNNIGRYGHVPVWLDKTCSRWKCVVAMREFGGKWRYFCLMENPTTGQRAILNTNQVHNFY